MHSILLVGAGQLGSRHLQGIALLNDACKIFVLDTSISSLSLAKLRFEEVIGHKRHIISFCQDLEGVSESSISIVIVATNSDIRGSIIKTILKSKRVSFFILEKVLFQSLNEYDEIELVLRDYQTKAFVNCPRRMNPAYQYLRELLVDQENIQMDVVGSGWNLGSNAIHFIDLFSFLTKEVNLKWIENLDMDISESKRKGFKEFTGRMLGVGYNGINRLSLTCSKQGISNLEVRISTAEMRILVCEDTGVSIDFLESNRVDYKTINMKLQSESTNLVADQLFETGSCILTPYAESASLHKPFLGALLNHYCLVEKLNTDICPIT